ncbi:MAG: L-arabinose ABC transporter [Campylobacter sp.]|nr:L-arabinose ABC transporter [Campylobacter sp.]
MCCFGIRVFLLFFITVLSFILHSFYADFAVIGYYFILANILAFVMNTLFFKGLLPDYVKIGAIAYFSLIGGVIGGILAMLIFRKFVWDKFTFLQLGFLLLWLIIICFVVLNFDFISQFLQNFIRKEA